MGIIFGQKKLISTNQLFRRW